MGIILVYPHKMQDSETPPGSSTDEEILHSTKLRFAEKYKQLIAEEEKRIQELTTSFSRLTQEASIARGKAESAGSQLKIAQDNAVVLARNLRYSQHLHVIDGTVYEKYDSKGCSFSAVPHPHYCQVVYYRETGYYLACGIDGCPGTQHW